MRTALRAAAGVAALACLLGPAGRAAAMCIPFPCEDCQVQAAGQVNWVHMDRENGRIRLIPNIRITGTGEDFALLMPAPAVPEVASVPRALWSQAFGLTAPLVRGGGGGGNDLGCGHTFSTEAADSPGEEDLAVRVLREVTVGAFLLTTLQATHAESLSVWLSAHGFAATGAEVQALAPYVARGWVFCAMRLDPAAGDLPADWDLNVDPVAFTFPGETLEVPLGLLAVNRGVSLPMAFFVVDDHRMTLAGFTTTYANRLSSRELASIEARYPVLAGELAAGDFLTRLDRTFAEEEPMARSITLAQAPSDDEFRRVIRRAGVMPLAAWSPLAGVALALAGAIGRTAQMRRRGSGF